MGTNNCWVDFNNLATDGRIILHYSMRHSSQNELQSAHSSVANILTIWQTIIWLRRPLLRDCQWKNTDKFGVGVIWWMITEGPGR